MTDKTLHAPLIIDVAGAELNAADRRRLADPLVGGVIHFTRNWQGRAQMPALNAEIKALRPDILICVDHEGGRVQRFRTDGFTRLWPSLWPVAAMVVSFILLALALRSLPIGTAYAVWTGIGAVGTGFFGIVVLNESADPMRLGCMGLIGAGIIGLKLASSG